MKPEVRVIGFDDSPHTRVDGRVPVVGVHMRGSSRIEGVLLTDVERDGDDSTAQIAACLRDSGLRGTRALLLDGASFGGFNVVDLEGLAEETHTPCLAFTKGVPDMRGMQAALQNVPNPEAKWHFISKRQTITLHGGAELGETPYPGVSPRPPPPNITISFAGIDREQAIELLALTTERGLVPEPLRVAHLIASIVR